MPTRIKRYEEKLEKLDSLLSRIELEMGPEAQLEAREFRRNGLLGMGGQRMVEIIATLSLEEQRSDVLRPARSGHTLRPARDTEAVDAEERAVLTGVATEPRDTVQIGTRRLAGEDISTRQLSEGESAQRLKEAFGRTAPEKYERKETAPLTQAAPLIAEPQQNAEIAELRSSLGEIRSMLASVASKQQLDSLRQEQSNEAISMPGRLSTEQERLEQTFRVQREARRQEEAPPAVARVADDPELEALREGLLLTQPDCSVFRQLLDWNIPASDGLELIRGVRRRMAADCDEAALLEGLQHEICRGVLLSGGLKLTEGSRLVVALVGPTGVGKTTTIAKLAAQAVFDHGYRVAVVSMDNYRIAAVDQLRNYAEIMGLRFEVVFSAAEYSNILEQLQDYDLVLVDTAGRSPGCCEQIAEGALMFADERPDEVHLVVAAGTLARDMQLILESFAVLEFDRLIVSKLDETQGLGGLYNLSQLSGKPVSYFTVGQSVPEDIRTAEPEFVNELKYKGTERT